MRILVLEDEEQLNGLIRGFLVSNGMVCKQALTLSQARLELASNAYDLLLCDLNLPDGSGLDVVDYARKNLPNMGIVIISAKDQLRDRLKGLELGADDYLVKPFDFHELLARTKAVQRRRVGESDSKIKIGAVTLDMQQKMAKKDGQTVELTYSEWEVLEILVAAHGRVLERKFLESSLYGHQGDVESNTVEVYISRLRKKLGSKLISTIRGIGYRLDIDQ